jgi:hypothetical protein
VAPNDQEKISIHPLWRSDFPFVAPDEIFSILAFKSVNVPVGVLISTSGMTDPAIMADLITADRESKLRMSVKEWLAGMSRAEVVTDPARHQRSDQTLS